MTKGSRVVFAVISACAALGLVPAGLAMAAEDPVATATAGVAIVRTADGVGTAFAIADGRLLTAAHVVGADSTVEVTAAGRTVSARVERTSTSLDVALLSTALPLTPLVLRTHPPRLGEQVYAVGVALGDLSVTRGVVSGFRDDSGFSHVQTDAAINPGNSGGPLLGDDGQVIGLVVSKLRNSEGIALSVSAADLSTFVRSASNAASTAGATPSSPTSAASTGTPSAPAAWYYGAPPWLWLALVGAGLAFLVRTRRRPVVVRLGPVRAASPAQTGTGVHLTLGDIEPVTPQAPTKDR